MLEEIRRRLADYRTVLEPDRDAPEWWAGAPSVVRGHDGAWHLAARMREGHSPKGSRGYALRILRSEDGERFEPVCDIPRESVPVAGFERPALVMVPGAERYRLYACAGHAEGWRILRLDDVADPATFDGATARSVLAAAPGGDPFARVTGYKDPFVWHDGRRWHMVMIGSDRVERPWHTTSLDGETWTAPRGPLLANTGWHDFYTRPACVVPMPVGWLFVYEGSNLGWHDPNYNIATGLAYTPDLVSFVDLTPDAPLAVSTTPGACMTWRYSDWVLDGDRLRVYFEAARPNDTNELRVAVLPLDLLRQAAAP